MSKVIVKSREGYEARREELLQRVGMTYEELDERAREYLLTATERSVWETIRSIDFLLGND
jgi:hypothetical protein